MRRVFFARCRRARPTAYEDPEPKNVSGARRLSGARRVRPRALCALALALLAGLVSPQLDTSSTAESCVDWEGRSARPLGTCLPHRVRWHARLRSSNRIACSTLGAASQPNVATMEPSFGAALSAAAEKSTVSAFASIAAHGLPSTVTALSLTACASGARSRSRSPPVGGDSA